MTTSNAAADTATKAGTQKAHEKLAEKRRALGRGLESLLPGPRVVQVPPTSPHSARTLPQRTRNGWGPRNDDPAEASKQPGYCDSGICAALTIGSKSQREATPLAPIWR